MTTAKFDVSQHEEVARYLGMSVEKVAKRALLSTALKVVQKITTVVIPGEPRPPVDRRIYAAGWRAKPVEGGAQIENTVPWAPVIEWGARGENVKIGRAMIDALAAWVIRKGLVAKEGRGAAAKEKQASEARAIAWAVAVALKKKGIFNEGKGLRILEKALKFVPGIFVEELRREIAREW